MVVEIEAGTVSECSRRILSALRGKRLRILKREMARAAKICRQDSVSGPQKQEQAELLSAIMDSIRASITGRRPCIDTEISLLGHLGRAC